MICRTILIDSSFWINEARQQRDPVKTLLAASHLHELAICGVIRAEVGRGIKNPIALNRLQAFWDVMIYAQTDHQLWNETEKLLWSLDRRGVIIPLSDAVIACCALRLQAVLLTLDHHFEAIPGLKTIRSVNEL